MALEEQIEKEYHVSWYIIAYKFAFGLVEFLLGAGVTLFGRKALIWYRAYAIQELSEDPHDLLVRLTQSIVPNVLTHRTTLAIYLIVLGVAKIAGAIGLMYKRNWGADLLVVITLIMFPFQFVALIRHPSAPDFFYIFIGLFIAFYLINFHPREWTRHIVHRVTRRA